MSLPAVTVVIPTRDRPALLALTLRSVLAQNQADMQVVLVDDGDGSETAALVDACADPRLHLVRNTGPRGASAARNVGVSLARSEWVAFCDDDDLWAPGKLAAQLAAAVDARAAWAYAGDVTVGPDLRVRSGSPPPLPEQVMRDLARHNAVPAGASNVVVRAGVLARAGPFDTRLRTSEDWDMWLRLARIAGPPAVVACPHVAVRVHPGMASRCMAQVLIDIEVIARRHGLPVDRARHHRWAAWTALESGHRRTAVRHYALAAAAGDLRSVGRAVMAIVDPGVAHRRSAPPDDPWVQEAQTWLDVLRHGLGRPPC